MRSVELFTGAGGLALGLHRAGFQHLLMVERDRAACATLRLNSQRRAVTGIDWPVHEGDVTAVEYGPNLADEEIDLLAGGPPCQPFSLGGKHAGEGDARNLFPQVFRAVRDPRPRAFLFENVRGLARRSFLPYFEYILDQLRYPFVRQRDDEDWEQHAARLRAAHVARDSLGQAAACRYDVWSALVNVADYGVPQERHRVFIVGFRHDLGSRWRFPARTHSDDALLYAQYVDGSYWDRHGLPWRPPTDGLQRRVARLAAQPRPLLAPWRTVRDALGDLPEPVDFIAHPEYDNHVGIPDARAYPGHTGSPWDWPAKVIKAGDHGNPGGENMLRRDDGSVRYFTVRELARLQTFPDEWHFASSWTESRRQLGNAVPVLMAETLARGIRALLERPASSAGVPAGGATLVATDA